MASTESHTARSQPTGPLSQRVQRVASRHWTRRRIPVLIALAGLALAGWLVYAFAYPYGVRVYHERAGDAASAVYDYPAARAHLERCLQVWPHDAELVFKLAQASRRDGDFAAADSLLGRAEALGFNAGACALERLLLQAQTGELDAVEATLVSHLQSGHPDELLILEALIQAYLDIHHPREVQRWATFWNQRYPNDWRPHYYRGWSFDMEHRFDQASVEFEAALRLNPDAYVVHKHFGNLLREKGLLREAVPHLEFCRQRRPDDPAVIVNLARCLRNLGNAEVACELLDGWLAGHGPTDVGVLALRGRVERDLSSPERALPWLRQAEKLSPRDPDTITMLCVVLRELGQQEEARGYDRRADDIRAQFSRLDALSKILAISPDDVETRFEIGTILLRLGHEKLGVFYLRTVLKLNGTHRRAHLALAEYHEAKGEHAEAGEHRLAAEGKLQVVRPGR